MELAQRDSVSNISRRYRHLFRLPSSRRTFTFASIPVLVTLILSRLVLHTNPLYILPLAVLAEFFLVAAVELDRFVLARHSKIATSRRLLAVSIISNLVSMIISVFALAAFSVTGSQTKFVSLVILGVFFSVSFRAIVFGPVFYERPWRALPISFVQPVLLGAVYLGGYVLIGEPQYAPVPAITAGLVSVFAVELYLWAIDRSKSIANFRPLELLRAFLDAWANEDALNLERFLDITSNPRKIVSRVLKLQSEKKDSSEDATPAVEIISPGLHPGPFYPIGSSNLPGDIYAGIHTDVLLPLTIHSISDHDLNLPSKNQVEKYISSLRSDARLLESGTKMSEPQSKTLNKVTVNGLAFGKTVLLTLSQAPHGMEDFPETAGSEIVAYANSRGFINAIVVDTHNSEGLKPNEKETKDAIDCSKIIIDSLKDSPQGDFSIGFAHSSEVEGWSSPDVGPAGVGLILFETDNNKRFSLTVSDSNNSALGFREKALRQFQAKAGESVLELCTSDTHVTAAKTATAKGYLALGDVVSPENFSDLLVELNKKARNRMGKASFASEVLDTEVKTIGNEVLRDFSGLLDVASSVAKDGARVLIGLVIVLTVIVALI